MRGYAVIDHLERTIVVRFASVLITVVVTIVLLAGLQTHRASSDDPLASFDLHPGFQIELIAQEPLVTDPIDMEIDEYGRLYVLEFHSYPNDWSGRDRIVQLKDTDGDGVMDDRIVFRDSLAQAMGIMRWKDGLIVTAPPDVIYLEDSDGDGRADVERTLLTGFHQGDGEGDVNNPTYGLDNWIYLGNRRSSGRDVHFPERPDADRIDAQNVNRNVRFRPDTYDVEAQSSGTQFGHAFDSWGRQLLNSNRNHVYQEVVAARYLDRNPDLLVAGATATISDHGAAAKIYPVTANPDYQILTDVGEITSACGITVYDGGAFPEGFENVSFVAEPSHNLVHADRLTSAGPALEASRIRPHTEFLSSTDAHFRPVNFYVGPDGALYVVDYYRRIIEGPEWIADEVLESENIFAGSDKGRIYRITPTGAPAADWMSGLDLGDASDDELVSRIASPNGWWRRNAQRILVERDSESVTDDLEALARTASPLSRSQALWTLEGLGQLSANVIREALRDAEPGVRENAIRLAELHLDSAPSLADELLNLRDDPDARVRFQLLLTLGYLDSEEAAAARQGLLFGNVDNEWMQVAALSSPFMQEGAVLDTVLDAYQPAYASFVQRLSALTAVNRSWDRVADLLNDAVAGAGEASWQTPVLQGLAQGLAERDVPETFLLDGVIDAFFDHPSRSLRTAALDLLATTGLPSERAGAVQRARDIVREEGAEPERRAQAVTLLTLDDPDRHAAMMMGLIDPTQPVEVQVAAFRGLGEAEGLHVMQVALDSWPELTQTVRDAAIDAVLDRPFQLDRVEMLLAALEEGIVKPSNIGWLDQVTLMRDLPEDMKQRARASIRRPAEALERETAAYVERVKRLTPRAEQGRAVFYQSCARCHALGDIAAGSDVGPDLMSVRGWLRDDVIDEIVRPGKAVVRGYELWQLHLHTGETVQGMISAETANAVILRDANGQETTYARSNIASMSSLEGSIMPSDFETTLSDQQMSDLVAFIRLGK